MRNYSCLHTEEVSAKPGEQEAPEEKVCGILSEIKYGKMAENHEPRQGQVGSEQEVIGVTFLFQRWADKYLKPFSYDLIICE